MPSGPDAFYGCMVKRVRLTSNSVIGFVNSAFMDSVMGVLTCVRTSAIAEELDVWKISLKYYVAMATIPSSDSSSRPIWSTKRVIRFRARHCFVVA